MRPFTAKIATISMLRQLRPVAKALFIAALLTACGEEKPATVGPAKQRNTKPGPQKALNPDELQTEILGRESITGPISATALTLYFRASDPSAAFECKLSEEASFALCPENDRYAFVGLKDQQTVKLWVRARVQHKIDPSPAVVEFRIDLKHGAMPYLRGERQVPAAEIREKIVDQLAGHDASFQLGPLFETHVPGFMSIRNFSTTQTITGSIYAFSQLLQTSSPSGVGTEGCNRDWEQTVTIADQRQFCEATPTISQWGSAYQRQYPLNHVEMVGVFGGQVYERVLTAAYGPWPDASEVAFEGNTVCNGARGVGRARLPKLMSALASRQSELTWCWYGKGNTVEWWQGVATIAMGPGIDAPRIKVVYGISSARGIYSSDQFIRRMDEFLPSVITAIGETAPSQQ